ncbi:MAG: HD domain-containing protein [Chloroflexi bacterium]|nr:HD domain-containing protein [Chloroflexota bacterium]
MSSIMPRNKGTRSSATGTTSKMGDYIEDFYRKCETTIRKTKVWYRAAITGLQSNIAGLLCYSLGWISGIVLLLIKKEDNFVRFHAWQSIVTFGILTVPILVLNLLPPTNVILYWFLVILYWIIITFSLFLWIFLMFKAYQGQTYRLHVASDIVSKLAHAGGRKVFTDEEVRFAVEVAGDTATVVEAPKLERKIQQDIESLRGVLTETVKSIVILGETRDPYTAGHQQRVAELACAIAGEMGLSEDQIEGIRVMGVIHDIGKVAVPAEILSRPGKLSNYEFGIIKTHPQAAYDILKGLEFPWPVAQAILQHHERLNGSGYPNGLSGEDIILEARILGVSDVVEAMASHRPYRPALGMDKALNEISQNKGTVYDANVVDVCLKLFTQKRFKWSTAV